MKTILLFAAFFLAQTISVQAQQVPGINRILLSGLVGRVRNCVKLPVSFDRSGQKILHPLISHCPEVRVVDKGVAKVRVNSHSFRISMKEAKDSDADLYDVLIEDERTHEASMIQSVLAFGDPLLGVLGGKLQGIREVVAPSKR